MDTHTCKDGNHLCSQNIERKTACLNGVSLKKVVIQKCVRGCAGAD